jgi:hypothetical protein
MRAPFLAKQLFVDFSRLLKSLLRCDSVVKIDELAASFD